MTSPAAEDASALSSHAMAIAPRKRRRAATDPESKCVAVVLRPGMRQREYRRVERRLEKNRMTTIPVIVGAPAKRAGASPPICGVIIVGSKGMARRADQSGLEAVVQDAAERDTPILALSDAGPLALAALGKAAPDEPCAGVLIGDDIEPLKAEDIDRAIDRMGAATPR